MIPPKFMAYDKENKRLYNYEEIYLIGNGGKFVYLCYNGPGDWDLDMMTSIGGNNLELMQFTGFHDSDKTDIYYGHIIEHDYPILISPLIMDEEWFLHEYSGVLFDPLEKIHTKIIGHKWEESS